jgi:hypothetical protein
VEILTTASAPRGLSESGAFEGGDQMAIGKRKSVGGGFLQNLKYDARTGQLFAVDRVRADDGQWTNVKKDITECFRAIFDFASLEVGWIFYPVGAPPEERLARIMH